MENNSRRTFLGVCLGGIAAVFMAGLVYPVFRYLAPAKESAGTGKVTIPEGELAEGEAKFIQFAGSAAVVVRKKGGALMALSAVCTHLGCIVQWQKERQEFLCPCHAGLYAAEGTVLSGPPPKPLQKLPVAMANGVITVG